MTAALTKTLVVIAFLLSLPGVLLMCAAIALHDWTENKRV
jgi:hypothetical protein